MSANSETHNFKSTQNTSRKRHAQQNLHNHSPTSQKQNKREKHSIFLSEQEKKLQERCRKFGVPYEMPEQNETYLKLKNRKKILNRQIEKTKTYQINENDIPHLLLLLKTTKFLIKLWIQYEHSNSNNRSISFNFVQFVMRGD